MNKTWFVSFVYKRQSHDHFKISFIKLTNSDVKIYKVT